MPPQKRTPQQVREDKAAVLAAATDVLSRRVGALADAVQINNAKIDQFQAELNAKPDDVELKLIAAVTHRERREVFRRSVASAILVAFVAALVAFQVADRMARERCETNATNIDALARVLETAPNKERYQPTIDILRDNRNEC